MVFERIAGEIKETSTVTVYFVLVVYDEVLRFKSLREKNHDHWITRD